MKQDAAFLPGSVGVVFADSAVLSRHLEINSRSTEQAPAENYSKAKIDNQWARHAQLGPPSVIHRTFVCKQALATASSTKPYTDRSYVRAYEKKAC